MRPAVGEVELAQGQLDRRRLDELLVERVDDDLTIVNQSQDFGFA
jgi:hypothetical protein